VRYDDTARPSTLDWGLLFLRVAAGLMMAFHGWGKVQTLLAGEGFADPIGIGETPSLILAAFAEFLCALLVVIGFKVRWAAIPPAITMLVAAFIVHAPDPWGRKEMAVLYAVIFLTLVLTGGGRFSLDGNLARRR
jgi:putative oxidoreductase